MSTSAKIRVALAMSSLFVSTWTIARLASRYDPHWAIVLIMFSAIGAVIGIIMANVRGAFIGACIGLAVGALVIPFEIMLWLEFTLPPYRQYDF
jgi:hypothetical protein